MAGHLVDEPIPEPHLRRLAEHVTSDGQVLDVFGKRRQHQPGFLLTFQFGLWKATNRRNDQGVRHLQEQAASPLAVGILRVDQSPQDVGLTLEQARLRITARYEKFLRRPLVYLDLEASRPVKVTVTGQVERPGMFSLPSTTATGWPTLVDVVQTAGGVTATGDLSRIEVLRPSATPGGRPSTYQFDYLTVLRDGGHAPNPLIYDGDSIRVHQSKGANNSDLITTAASNFAPDTIKVNVIGEVTRPGVQQVPSNAPLSQAILSSGGITRRGSESKVELIRVDGNGRSTVTAMTFDPKAVLSSPTNPPLRQGDVVVVNRTSLAKVTDGLTDAFSPLTPIVNAASIFRILGLPTGLAN